MGQNSTEVAYGFGQLGSAHMHNDNAQTLTPPDDMVIVAITMLSDTVFDILTPDTNNSVDIVAQKVVTYILVLVQQLTKVVIASKLIQV